MRRPVRSWHSFTSLKTTSAVIIGVLAGAGTMSLFTTTERRINSTAPVEATALLGDAITAIKARDYAAFEQVTHLTKEVESAILEQSSEALAHEFAGKLDFEYLIQLRISDTEVRHIWKLVSRDTLKEGTVSMRVSAGRISYFTIE